MSYRFSCDHCGKKFELETSPAKECPFCFWTSSVKSEDELSARDKLVSSAAHKPTAGSSIKILPVVAKQLFRILFFLILFAGIGLLAYKAYSFFGTVSSKRSQGIVIRPGNPDQTGSPSPAVSGVAMLTSAEKEILDREVVIPQDRTPDAGEQAILGKTIPLQTGWVEKLPSAAWTLEQYQKMIADQEAFYKMPFARSYKKKLEELFKAKYLAAVDAFTKGDALAARDLWVASLAFPLYSQDLKKHRAVALTMLRPFINDTLSKVSAMNQSLLDRDKKQREQALSAAYQGLSALIAKKKWNEALTVIDKLTPEVNALQKNTSAQQAPPQYPEAFGAIDADLQQPLMGLMAPAPASTLNLQPLQQDLVEKRQVLETFTEAYLKEAMESYQSGRAAIREEKWPEASQAFGTIQGPPMLQQDAAQKVAILAKLQPQAMAQEATDPVKNIS